MNRKSSPQLIFVMNFAMIIFLLSSQMNKKKELFLVEFLSLRDRFDSS